MSPKGLSRFFHGFAGDLTYQTFIENFTVQGLSNSCGQDLGLRCEVKGSGLCSWSVFLLACVLSANLSIFDPLACKSL